MRKQKIMKKAQKHNITVEDDGERITVDAPAGYIFTGRDLHFFDIYYAGARFTKPEAWDAVWEDIKDGVELCDNPDCETCEEARLNGAKIGEPVDKKNLPANKNVNLLERVEL